MQGVLSTLLNHRLLVSTRFSLQNRPFIQIDLETVSRIIRDRIQRAHNAIISAQHSFYPDSQLQKSASGRLVNLRRAGGL